MTNYNTNRDIISIQSSHKINQHALTVTLKRSCWTKASDGISMVTSLFPLGIQQSYFIVTTGGTLLWFWSCKDQSSHCYKSVKISLYSQGDVELLKAMKCEGSSCYGALHFIHAQSVSVCLSSAWHSGSSPSLCPLRLCQHHCPLSCLRLSGISPQNCR